MKCERQLNERCSNKILNVRYKPQDWHVTDLSREKNINAGDTTMVWRKQQVDWKKRLDWTRCRGFSVTNANILLDLHAWMPSEVFK